MTKVIRSYNKMAAALLQYELLHLQGWSQAAESAPHRLTAALLVRHQNSKVPHDVMILQRCDPAGCCRTCSRTVTQLPSHTDSDTV